jgi:hypothetical protein
MTTILAVLLAASLVLNAVQFGMLKTAKKKYRDLVR